MLRLLLVRLCLLFLFGLRFGLAFRGRSFAFDYLLKKREELVGDVKDFLVVFMGGFGLFNFIDDGFESFIDFGLLDGLFGQTVRTFKEGQESRDQRLGIVLLFD